jgi:hypothetical protein
MKFVGRNSAGWTNLLAVVAETSIDLIWVRKFEGEGTDPYIPDLHFAEIMMGAMLFSTPDMCVRPQWSTVSFQILAICTFIRNLYRTETPSVFMPRF